MIRGRHYTEAEIARKGRLARAMREAGYSQAQMLRRLKIDYTRLKVMLGEADSMRKKQRADKGLDMTRLPVMGAVCVGMRQTHHFGGEPTCRYCGAARKTKGGAL